MREKKKADEHEVAVKSRRLTSFREKIEGLTEAITFAEAGLQEEAQGLIRAELAERRKVLVVGHEDTFSKPLQAYAVGFAERMGYEIVALNVTSVQTESPWQESDQDMLCEQFRSRCEEKVGAFRQPCRERGIGFTHLVKFGEVAQCIRGSCEELRRVEFVLAERKSCPEEEIVGIPVYCVTS